MKYNQLGNKFFINVPVLKEADIDLTYLDCYVYGYINKKSNDFLNISKNLEISKYKLKTITSKLEHLGCIEKNNNNFSIVNDKKNIFFNFEEQFLYDRTYLPNKKFLSIKQNAVFWKLYKYADPVDGMKNYYTIGTKKDIKKIDYEYLGKVLKFSLYFIKKSINKLKSIKLIKTQTEKESFYFGIQPIKEEMKIYWNDEERNIENIVVDQKTILDFYER
jgi:hypothetical protein